jgi:hypothetical protein
VLIGREQWREHLPWVLSCAAATAAATGWYAVEVARTGRWITGSSAPGYALGVVGGLIIVFEMLLWWRKQVRTMRIGRVKVWMRAHIWLGLLCYPLLLLHSGFYLGGPLSQVLLVLLTVVVASGVWGLVLQNTLPKRMLMDVPAETIHSEIGHVVRLSLNEADRLVVDTCGPRPGEVPRPAEELDAVGRAPSRFLTVGAVRTAGHVQGKVVETRVPRPPVAGSEPLRGFFDGLLHPYLEEIAEAEEANGRPASRARRDGPSPLESPSKSAALFQDLRTKVPPEALDAVNALERIADQRRQLGRQQRLHVWLHSWLLVHLPLSVALLVLMFIHAIQATRYW